MYPKNSRSALAALVFAGGLWAYKNRDKVRGWLNSQARASSTALPPSTTDSSYTGATHRFDEPTNTGTSTTYPNEQRNTWTPES